MKILLLKIDYRNEWFFLNSFFFNQQIVFLNFEFFWFSYCPLKMQFKKKN